jgi:cytochrome P450
MSTPEDMEQHLARLFGLIERAWADPREAIARSTATPQEMYAELTARGPVKDLGNNMYILLTMADIQYVTKHHDVEQGTKYLGSDRPAIPLGLDGADHRKYRRLLDPVFTARRIEPLAERVQALAHELIDRFVDSGSVDAYAEWCEPLPSTIFLSIMGLPMGDLDKFLHFKNLVLGNEALHRVPPEERIAARHEAVTWIHGYFNAELDAREHDLKPRDDMTSWLLGTEVEGERLSRQEVLDIIGLLMIAGLDTVAASLACFLSFFARNPEQRERILEQPDLMTSAVEELMRFESPVVDGYRLANADLGLPSGAHLPAGSMMVLSWSAANLDGAVFELPLHVNLDRKPNPHIGFASGFHRCLGSHLARMEMRAALGAWHERIPRYDIAPGAELIYSGNPRAPHRLPLVWPAAPDVEPPVHRR